MIFSSPKWYWLVLRSPHRKAFAYHHLTHPRPKRQGSLQGCQDLSKGCYYPHAILVASLESFSCHNCHYSYLIQTWLLACLQIKSCLALILRIPACESYLWLAPFQTLLQTWSPLHKAWAFKEAQYQRYTPTSSFFSWTLYTYRDSLQVPHTPAGASWGKVVQI